MVSSKKCTVCQNVLPLDNQSFAIWKRSKDGFSSSCKKCKREYDKQYRERNKEKLTEKQRQYSLENREKINERTAEWRRNNPEKVAAWKLENKELISESNKRYWAENKEYAKSQTAEWRERNKEHIRKYRKENIERDRERARIWTKTKDGNAFSRTRTNKRRAMLRELPNDFTATDWTVCLEYFNHSCGYCGVSEVLLEQEHVIALSKGGGLVKSNIVPSCRSCNGSKSNKDFESWYRGYEFYSEKRESIILQYLNLMKKSEKEGTG